MTEVRYMISDVSRILDMPTNVLRYLEYCLSLNIKRTDLGYRYYLQEDIDLLDNVRILRDKGFHMKVIKSILPYIDKVKDLDAKRLLELKERLEAALGLSGLEAKESLKSQYGKVIDIDMEEGDFVYKDPTTQQKTRLSSVTIKTEEVNTQPIDLEIDNNMSCEEVAATDVVIKESHLDEETVNPSKELDQTRVEEALVNEEKVFSRTNKVDKLNNKLDKKLDKKKDKKAAKIYDIKQAKPDYFMGAKKDHVTVLVGKKEDKLDSNVEDFQVRKKDDLSINKAEKELTARECIVEDSFDSKTEKQLTSKAELQLRTKAEKQMDSQAEHPLSANKAVDLLTEPDKKVDGISSEGRNICTTQESLLKDSQDKIVQFRQIMCSIVMDALRQNNNTLTNEINNTVTQSIVKEMDYMMRVREERQEERFRQLDRTIRETQLQRQQAAATKEGKKKPSKFFSKNKVRI